MKHIERRITDSIRLIYPAPEAEAASLIEASCLRSLETIRWLWGPPEPEDCRVYVMTSMLRFIYCSSGIRVKISLTLFLPFWYRAMRKFWPLTAGLTRQVKDRPIVGVKPPRLLVEADTRIGERLFIKEADMIRKLESTVCHELTHAFFSHLKLPNWLNEGVAMLSVDEHFQHESVRRDTLDLLNEGRGAVGASSALGYAKLKPEEVVCVYARGYWLTRFLRERHPDVLRSFLTQERTAQQFDAELARLLGVPLHLLWIEVDRGLYRYFSG